LKWTPAPQPGGNGRALANPRGLAWVPRPRYRLWGGRYYRPARCA